MSRETISHLTISTARSYPEIGRAIRMDARGEVLQIAQPIKSRPVVGEQPPVQEQAGVPVVAKKEQAMGQVVRNFLKLPPATPLPPNIGQSLEAVQDYIHAHGLTGQLGEQVSLETALAIASGVTPEAAIGRLKIKLPPEEVRAHRENAPDVGVKIPSKTDIVKAIASDPHRIESLIRFNDTRQAEASWRAFIETEAQKTKGGPLTQEERNELKLEAWQMAAAAEGMGPILAIRGAAVDVSSLNPKTYDTDPMLARTARIIKALGDNEGLEDGEVDSYITDIKRDVTEGKVDESLGMQLMSELRRLKKSAVAEEERQAQERALEPPIIYVIEDDTIDAVIDEKVHPDVALVRIGDILEAQEVEKKGGRPITDENERRRVRAAIPQRYAEAIRRDKLVFRRIPPERKPASIPTLIATITAVQNAATVVEARHAGKDFRWFTEGLVPTEHTRDQYYQVMQLYQLMKKSNDLGEIQKAAREFGEGMVELGEQMMWEERIEDAMFMPDSFEEWGLLIALSAPADFQTGGRYEIVTKDRKLMPEHVDLWVRAREFHFHGASSTDPGLNLFGLVGSRQRLRDWSVGDTLNNWERVFRKLEMTFEGFVEDRRRLVVRGDIKRVENSRYERIKDWILYPVWQFGVWRRDRIKSRDPGINDENKWLQYLAETYIWDEAYRGIPRSNLTYVWSHPSAFIPETYGEPDQLDANHLVGDCIRRAVMVLSNIGDYERLRMLLPEDSVFWQRTHLKGGFQGEPVDGVGLAISGEPDTAWKASWYDNNGRFKFNDRKVVAEFMQWVNIYGEQQKDQFTINQVKESLIQDCMYDLAGIFLWENESTPAPDKVVDEIRRLLSSSSAVDRKKYSEMDEDDLARTAFRNLREKNKTRQLDQLVNQRKIQLGAQEIAEIGIEIGEWDSETQKKVARGEVRSSDVPQLRRQHELYLEGKMKRRLVTPMLHAAYRKRVADLNNPDVEELRRRAYKEAQFAVEWGYQFPGPTTANIKEDFNFRAFIGGLRALATKKFREKQFTKISVAGFHQSVPLIHATAPELYDAIQTLEGKTPNEILWDLQKINWFAEAYLPIKDRRKISKVMDKVVFPEDTARNAAGILYKSAVDAYTSIEKGTLPDLSIEPTIVTTEGTKIKYNLLEVQEKFMSEVKKWRNLLSTYGHINLSKIVRVFTELDQDGVPVWEDMPMGQAMFGRLILAHSQYYKRATNSQGQLIDRKGKVVTDRNKAAVVDKGGKILDTGNEKGDKTAFLESAAIDFSLIHKDKKRFWVYPFLGNLAANIRAQNYGVNEDPRSPYIRHLGSAEVRKYIKVMGTLIGNVNEGDRYFGVATGPAFSDYELVWFSQMCGEPLSIEEIRNGYIT